VAILLALFADFLVTPVLILWVKPFGKEKLHTDEADETL
jgi:hypothetical protein